MQPNSIYRCFDFKFIWFLLFGVDLNRRLLTPCLYKNWFWWGLDLVADGLVLIFVAGTWYLLAS